VERLETPQRWTLARRLTATLVGCVLVSGTLAFLVHDRALQAGLRQNAEQRLARAARAGELLLADHLGQLEERYRAVASAPQLRATLGVGHAPTSRNLAEQLRKEHGAALITFVDPNGVLQARSGSAALAQAVAEDPAPRLLYEGGELYAAVSVPVPLGGRRTHRVWVAEPVGEALLTRWSELCGAPLAVEAPEGAGAELLVTPVRIGEGAALFVSSDLGPEREALASARRKLALAGCVALVVMFVASVLLARSLVRRIRRVQNALLRIGRGELSTRLESRRSDEIGEVARGVDRMAAELAARDDALRESQAHLAKAQRIARLGSFELDLDSGALMASEEFWTLYSLEGQDAGTRGLTERIHPEDRGPLLEAVRDSIEAGVGGQLDYRIQLADGGERFLQTQFQVLRSDAGKATRIEGTVQDLTERERTAQQIRYLAYHDGLTGLGNRKLFGELVELASARAGRRRRRTGVLLLDLDDFKRINDTLGYAAGDALLREVADRLVRGAREAEPVRRELDQGFEPAVARLGADEFAVLVGEVEDASDLVDMAEHLLHALQQPWRLDGHDFVIHASVGVAIWPTDGEDIETLLSNADAAMHHAKANHRGGLQFYDASMNEVAQRRLAVELRLRQALERGDLALHLQPKLEIASGRIVGFEALARWNDPELGVVSPADFVPVAEQTGLIAPLGRWVLEELCQHLSQAEDALARSGARVSFNVSTREFGPHLVRDIMATLERHGVAAERLQLEITESAIMRDERSVVAALEELRELGFSIALDDFGTGYSSLSYLRGLPVDTLKMDGSFIRSITSDAEAAALTRSIVAMGKALGLRVVAEGVEKRAQRTLLKKWGCHEIQGYLTGAPVPAAEALAALEARPRRPKRSVAG
jgi:diguanylate cyclase (GGDEF)-like protein/PAS domain S-box-containing protein